MEWIVSIRTDFLTSLFTLITQLGEETFLMGFVCLGYWGWNKKFFRDFIFLMLATTVVCQAIKEWFALERPAVEYLAHVSDLYAFPSGHTMIMTVFCFVLAVQMKRGWFWWASLAVVLAVGFSRVYLGVHYPRDVIGGIVFGMMMVIAYELLKNSIYWSLFSRNKAMMVGLVFLSLGIYYCLVFGNVSPTGVLACGALLGGVVGHYIENRFVRYKVPSDYGMKFIACGVGLLMVFGYRYLAGVVTGGHLTGWAQFTKYFISMFIIICVVPAMMKRIQGRFAGGESVLT